jgi:hypothetical protein
MMDCSVAFVNSDLGSHWNSLVVAWYFVLYITTVATNDFVQLYVVIAYVVRQCFYFQYIPSFAVTFIEPDASQVNHRTWL